MLKINKKASTIISIVLIVLLSAILLCNLSIIIQGAVNPEEPPSLFGLTPLIVLSGSMEGDADDCFQTGSMIFTKKVDPDALVIGDVIAFHDPASKSNAITTHRIIDVRTLDDGNRQFITKGDANNAADRLPVNEDDVVGKYSFHIGAIGTFAMFLQEPLGMLIFIGVPVAAFILFMVISKRRAPDPKRAELEAELERLRAMAAGMSSDTSTEGGENTEDGEKQDAEGGESGSDKTDA